MMETTGLRRETRIDQAMTLSRQTIQAVEILGYSQEELEVFLREAMNGNPLLTEDSTAQGTDGPAGYSPNRPVAASLRTRMPGHGTAPRDRYDEADDTAMERLAAVPVSLRDVLYRQLAGRHCTEGQRLLVCALIDSLDPDGYLRTDVKVLADLFETSVDELGQALATVQEMEPAGVGARDVAECFRLQLDHAGQLTPVLERLLEGLHWVEQGEVARLARHCQVDVGRIPALIARLRELNPRPGLAFDASPVQPALPDVLVSVGHDEYIRVEMNPDLLPRVLMDRHYYNELAPQLERSQEVAYLDVCAREARQVIRQLDQRTTTILKVATEVVRHQREFILKGMRHLRPLSQKQVANALGIHESTVSRAIAHKYIWCPLGVFALKDLLCEAEKGLQAPSGVAANAVRYRIDQLTKMESAPEGVLSDDDIVSVLQQEGITIARRTVAKYRQQLRIPSSSQRRRHMRLTGL